MGVDFAVLNGKLRPLPRSEIIGATFMVKTAWSFTVVGCGKIWIHAKGGPFDKRYNIRRSLFDLMIDIGTYYKISE